VVDLSVQLGPLRLQHPLINASGTLELFDLASSVDKGFLTEPPVAAYVAKTITLAPRAGNRPPRVLETPQGMINAIGLPGEGLVAFVSDSLPRLLALPCPLVVSIGGFSTDEYVTMATSLCRAMDAQVGEGWTARAGLELNVSCPNVHSGCASIGSDPGETERVVGAVRAVWPGLLMAKLTPNVTDVVAVGQAAERAGADAIVAVNTFKGMVLDRSTLKPYLGNITGGLSGPAIKPLALRVVYELYEGLTVPIVGMGGVATAEDVLEFISCGARVVAVGSACLQDQSRARCLSEELGEELRNRGLSLEGLVGLAHRSD
jgi:dihydroorotate dehydrogenase (NAD+) catalytic subunit